MCRIITPFRQHFHFINIFTELHRQIAGIPTGTNCALLVTDLFLLCYERDFITSLSDETQDNIIEAFKSTSRYLDELLDVDNSYFEGMVTQIYPTELQLNKAKSMISGLHFFYFRLSVFLMVLFHLN